MYRSFQRQIERIDDIDRISVYIYVENQTHMAKTIYQFSLAKVFLFDYFRLNYSIFKV